MTGRIIRISGHEAEWLTEAWELAAVTAGGVKEPGKALEALDWTPTTVPATAAASLRNAGGWDLDGPVRDFDADDWWYRTTFATQRAASGEQLWLCLDGLATVAEVWLNGTRLLTSDSMFTAHEVRVDESLRAENELVICCRSLDRLLRVRRPRPRWRVPMLVHQQLRWFRTTLLGRTPGWSPPAAPVGPWRGIRLERRRGVAIEDLRLRADAEGNLTAACRVAALSGSGATSVELLVERDGRTHTAALTPSGAGDRFAGRLRVPDVRQWWPHTHGEPVLYAARLRVRRGTGTTDADLGALGFRTITLGAEGGDFSLQVNGVPVFCRGACWTPLDPVSLTAEPAAVDQVFTQMVDAGMNMIRVGGTMVYESDAFLDRCDARGVLLWQDFMFANMDYPDEDAAFVALVAREAAQQLARMQGRPSLAVLCGNSEGEQQAAMWGAARERWQPALFHQQLAALAREWAPDVPYWPSSTHGGQFPHQDDVGTTSYFGVGAYLRDLEDARRAAVRFASECLAFANVPEPRALGQVPEGYGSKVHHPSWKARSPRDLGAGWDFDDVRDHYLAKLFHTEPFALRYSDHDRYLALGRVTSGEVMAAVFGEWRRLRSTARGGLIWFLRDLWPGAGWGVIDATGTPKAAWHYLRRALAPVAVSLTDEGCNGMGVHVVNDPAAPLDGQLDLVLYRAGEVEVARGIRPVRVEAHSAVELNAGVFFDEWFDLSYAYRFGPPSHDLVVATLRDTRGALLAQAFHFVLGLPSARERDVGLSAEARPRPDGAWDLVVRTRRFAQAVRIDVDGFASSDNYFHVPPSGERHLVLRRLGGAGEAAPTAPRGSLQALNAEVPAIVAVAQ